MGMYILGSLMEGHNGPCNVGGVQQGYIYVGVITTGHYWKQLTLILCNPQHANRPHKHWSGCPSRPIQSNAGHAGPPCATAIHALAVVYKAPPFCLAPGYPNQTSAQLGARLPSANVDVLDRSSMSYRAACRKNRYTVCRPVCSCRCKN